MEHPNDGIHIERRIYRGKVDTPKSERSRRQVPPTPITAAIIAHYLELVIDRSTTGWLFASEAGTTRSATAMCTGGTSAGIKKIGLGHVNFQILRRTWVTEMAEVEDDPHVQVETGGP